MLLGFRLCKPHFDCLGTAIAPLTHLELYLLPLSQHGKLHTLKLAAMEEEVFTLCSLDEAESSVCD
jgi:hypothetical protein